MTHLDLLRQRSASPPRVRNAGAVTTARIWHCRFPSLAWLGQLRGLETLVIASYPDATLAPLADLTRLRTLRILHLPRVTELSPLSSLGALQSLSLETLPGWDAKGRRTFVASLDPLTALTELQHLQLFGVVGRDGGLSGLERLPSLRTVRFLGYPADDVARFRSKTGAADAFNPEPVFDRAPAE